MHLRFQASNAKCGHKVESKGGTCAWFASAAPSVGGQGARGHRKQRRHPPATTHRASGCWLAGGLATQALMWNALPLRSGRPS